MCPHGRDSGPFKKVNTEWSNTAGSDQKHKCVCSFPFTFGSGPVMDHISF